MSLGLDKEVNRSFLLALLSPGSGEIMGVISPAPLLSSKDAATSAEAGGPSVHTAGSLSF